MHNQTDEKLFLRFKDNHDCSALSELYKRYSHQVLAICHLYLKNREDSEDALMDIFNKIINTSPGKNINNFKSWLHVIIRNYCLNQIQKKKIIIKHESNIKEFHIHDMENNDIYSHIYGRIDLEIVIQTIKQLPEPQKTCLILFYEGEMTYQEIIEKTGYTFKQVKSHLQNGKRNLKNILISEGYIDETNK